MWQTLSSYVYLVMESTLDVFNIKVKRGVFEER